MSCAVNIHSWIGETELASICIVLLLILEVMAIFSSNEFTTDLALEGHK